MGAPKEPPAAALVRAAAENALAWARVAELLAALPRCGSEDGCARAATMVQHVNPCFPELVCDEHARGFEGDFDPVSWRAPMVALAAMLAEPGVPAERGRWVCPQCRAVVAIEGTAGEAGPPPDLPDEYQCAGGDHYLFWGENMLHVWAGGRKDWHPRGVGR